MGQGTHTGHAVIIADELGVDLDRVSVVTAEPADPFRRGGQMGSGGSWGVRDVVPAAAQGRGTGARRAHCGGGGRVGRARRAMPLERGEVVHEASQRKQGIGALAAAAAALPLPAEPALRPKAELRYTGRKVARVDLPAKVRGKPVFASDVERPGMVYACARLAPVFGAELDGFDRDSATVLPGVLDVVAVPGGAAVVASNSWAALRGAEALRIRFKPTAHDRLDSATISRQMRAGLADGQPINARKDGDWDAVAGAASASSRRTTKCRISRTRRWSRGTARSSSTRTAACTSGPRCRPRTATAMPPRRGRRCPGEGAAAHDAAGRWLRPATGIGRHRRGSVDGARGRGAR